MKALDQWVFWKSTIRDGKPTKIPVEVKSGKAAKSDDDATWCDFISAHNKFDDKKWQGVGFVFKKGCGITGIDLDGCRDPLTGKVEDWAKNIIEAVNSYTEVSPSGTGVKIFCKGTFALNGKKKELKGDEYQKIGDKNPGIEIYDHERYFAVTGLRLKVNSELRDAQDAIDFLTEMHWPVEQATTTPPSEYRSITGIMERARNYLRRVPPAVSGQDGHKQTYKTACILVKGFALNESEALQLMQEWNQGCVPPWSEKDLARKVREAMKAPGEVGHLRFASPQRWDSMQLPDYQPPPPKREIVAVTVADAARAYLEKIRTGNTNLISIGVPDVDHALEGGIEQGEIVIMAARSSHGKSTLAMQSVHQWTLDKIPCLIISEEMSKLALGKRTLQFISKTPQEHWHHSTNELEREVNAYEAERCSGYIIESVGSAAAAAEQMQKFKEEQGIRIAVIDYAQLLRSPGKGRYEQITNTCQTLVQSARQLGLTLVMLAQLNREIEKRTKFVPLMSDLRDSGQFEQDGDVVLFGVWPHRINSSAPANEYHVYVAKNRNRAINSPMVKCRFEPSRQRIIDEKPSDKPNHESSFDVFNQQGSDGEAYYGSGF
jgi:hypothetical protein